MEFDCAKQTPKKVAKNIIRTALNCINVGGELEAYENVTPQVLEQISKEVDVLVDRAYKYLTL